MVTKTNIGSHQGASINPLSFDEAYEILSKKMGKQYETAGNHSTFVANATVATKGNHKGNRVIIFLSNNNEMSRSYECCWGHKTNCNKAYIDCYTQVISA